METVTYSSMARFNNCPRSYFWRVVREIVSLQRRDALWFGTLIHDCQAAWHSDDCPKGWILEIIDKATSNRDTDPWAKGMWFKAIAMMTAYVKVYPFTEIKEHNYSKYKSDSFYIYTETIKPTYAIPSKIFTGLNMFSPPVS